MLSITINDPESEYVVLRNRQTGELIEVHAKKRNGKKQLRVGINAAKENWHVVRSTVLDKIRDGKGRESKP